MKYFALAFLALQNAALTMVSSYATHRQDVPAFLKNSAVVMSEVVKFIISLMVIFYQEGFSVRDFLQSLKENLIDQPMECLKVSVPAVIYFLQNLLLFCAVANLPPTVYQVS